GGGKGMRRVDALEDLDSSYEGTVREAQMSFGDDRVYVEKYIENPRHLEVQILGDGQGKILHLGERECSVQRRHQKILEETPSPSISSSLREKLLAAAIQLGQHVNYGSAGTVEFIVDDAENFYFLEMNTRLQVEHTVTEEVTGIDIVEWMLRLASGEPLSLLQSDISFSGHAIEARLYAEDSNVGFLPSVGRLSVFEVLEEEGIRIDSGVEGGNEITPFYDPMISKVVAYGGTRTQALERLNSCLESFVIKGVTTNRSFLRALLNHPDFQKGRVSTHFIADIFGEAFKPTLVKSHRDIVLAMAACLQKSLTEKSSFILQVQGEKKRIKASVQGKHLLIGEAGKPSSFSLDWISGKALGTLTFKGVEHIFQAFPLEGAPGWRLAYDVFEVDIRVWPGHMEKFMDRIPLERKTAQKTVVLSPMPGRVLDVFVQAGDACKSGQRLAIVEAMKMENIIRAPSDLSIKDVLVQPGDSVISGQALLKVA
ncbi:MAG: acetyl/propionyl-CoA carboxylase subunit alpha, partial [bacterium]|nr:acetyl/propionyl-CoA carboxylase subunit alpha [bacterium]